MKSTVKHKGVNLLTHISAASTPNHSSAKKQLKTFGKAHKLSRSDWEAIKQEAVTRLPARISSL